MEAIEKMVNEFQCPGCVAGSDTQCGKYKLDHRGESCESHSPGTRMLGSGAIYLGMPKGFNRVGAILDEQTHNIRLFPKGSSVDVYDHLNVPVWAMEWEGFLFVRCFVPRRNYSFVDVIEGGTLDMVPTATNVAEFIDEID